MKTYIRWFLVFSLACFLLTGDSSAFGQQNKSTTESEKFLLKDCKLNEFPLDAVQQRTVSAINNLVEATGGSPKGVDEFDGKKGTPVEILDSGSRIDDEDYAYKIVNGKKHEVTFSKDGEIKFLKVRLLKGKEKGKIGWVPKEYVGEASKGDFEVRLRAFIPCEVVTLSPTNAPIFRLPTDLNKDVPATDLKNPSLGGDNRTFSYEDGTHRAAQNVRGRIDVGFGNGGAPEIQRQWGVSHAYAPFQTEHVRGKPWWWFSLKKGMETPGFSKKLDEHDNNNFADLKYLDAGKAAKIRLYINGSVPLSDHAPPINLNLDVVIEEDPNEEGYLRWAITGTHDAFPSYEIYINKEPAYQHEADAIKGPAALLPDDQKGQPLKPVNRQVQVAKSGRVKSLNLQPANRVVIPKN
jgi:hypothetical protein